MSDDRRSGRSYAIAVAAVRQACRRPNVWVRVWDHVPTLRTAETTFRLTLDLIQADRYLSTHLQVQGQSQFRLTLSEPYNDWLPSEALPPIPEPEPPPPEPAALSALEQLLEDD